MPETAPADLTLRAFAGRGLACRRGERLVFSGLSFALPGGGTLLLTGPNGSGKSSLLRLLAGLSHPDAGSLSWDGVPVNDDPAAHRARLHFIGHQDAVKPALAVGETLRFWAGMHGGAAVAAALAHFRLEVVADWPCRHLSAGQRRRLALARLLASPAPLWLLDEPTTGLDAEAQADLLAAITAHRRSGGRVVLSTHAELAIADAAVLSLADFVPRRARPEVEQDAAAPRYE
ncbi:MAG TPA: heme ABC exporter ATP-binding protein CcmA [Stellaceae bacterium]|nr:heme ABC exporter ATP-binding protein CcmA [Stellaceae bacterium]